MAFLPGTKKPSSKEDNYPPYPCISRIMRDVMNLNEDPPPYIFVVHNEEEVIKLHALMIGTPDTPYSGGFFLFKLKCPNDYPIKPPAVKIMTTNGGKTRFNPNLYRNGKVCLSILGTWDGPAWSPAQTLTSVLISIQSLMNDKPYHNEPGFEKERKPGDVKNYNNIMTHETLRVAVVGMIENDTSLYIPKRFKNIMNKWFLDNYAMYISIVERHVHLDGQPMKDPFNDTSGAFRFADIRNRLELIYNRLSDQKKAGLLDAVYSEND